jgi:hypothetical protein
MNKLIYAGFYLSKLDCFLRKHSKTDIAMFFLENQGHTKSCCLIGQYIFTFLHIIGRLNVNGMLPDMTHMKVLLLDVKGSPKHLIFLLFLSSIKKWYLLQRLGFKKCKASERARNVTNKKQL